MRDRSVSQTLHADDLCRNRMKFNAITWKTEKLFQINELVRFPRQNKGFAKTSITTGGLGVESSNLSAPTNKQSPQLNRAGNAETEN